MDSATLLERLKEYLRRRTDEIMHEREIGASDDDRLRGKFAMLQEIYTKIAAWEDNSEPF